MKQLFSDNAIISEISSHVFKVVDDGVEMKLNVFPVGHRKYSKSMPVHQKAMKCGLRVPSIIRVVVDRGMVYKICKWVVGKTVSDVVRDNPSSAEGILFNIGKYMSDLYRHDITAVDNHLGNFIWDGGEVTYIDMKKLWIEKSKHIERMAKFCLKSCRGSREMVIAFLRGYEDGWGDINEIFEECKKRDWVWGSTKTKEIMVSEI